MILIFLFILGACLGSFAGAVAWRLHGGRNFISERSECEYCHHSLAPADLVPIVSWIWLRGRCRYCHLRLSVLHPLVEASMGALFAASYIWWPGDLLTGADYIHFGLWLIYLVGMAMLFLYDLKWQLLPDKILFPLIVIAIGEVLGVNVWLEGGGLGPIFQAGAGIAIISGFFGMLYLISKGRWIGFGDVKLGIFMGLVLGIPASLFALLGSYYIAAAVILPMFVTGVVNRRSKVAFGPFLILSMILCFFFEEGLKNWLAIFF